MDEATLDSAIAALKPAVESAFEAALSNPDTAKSADALKAAVIEAVFPNPDVDSADAAFKAAFEAAFNNPETAANLDALVAKSAEYDAFSDQLAKICKDLKYFFVGVHLIVLSVFVYKKWSARRTDGRTKKSGKDINNSIDDAKAASPPPKVGWRRWFWWTWEMKDLDIIAWTAMLAAYAVHGLGRDAIRLFHLMVQKGHEPDHVTFTHLLSACSHSGLVEEGKLYFEIMYTT